MKKDSKILNKKILKKIVKNKNNQSKLWLIYSNQAFKKVIMKDSQMTIKQTKLKNAKSIQTF